MIIKVVNQFPPGRRAPWTEGDWLLLTEGEGRSCVYAPCLHHLKVWRGRPDCRYTTLPATAPGTDWASGLETPLLPSQSAAPVLNQRPVGEAVAVFIFLCVSHSSCVELSPAETPQVLVFFWATAPLVFCDGLNALDVVVVIFVLSSFSSFRRRLRPLHRLIVVVASIRRDKDIR